MATVVWSVPLLAHDSNFTAQKQKKRKKKRRAGSSQRKSCRMRASNKLARRGVEVRTSEREGRREGWRREKELLSHYYPSVTGLLWSCYGYGDSRLSVLLTIAHKASIQHRATMQISFSPFLNLLLFTSGYIFLSSCSSVLPASQTDPPPPTCQCNPHLLLNISIFLFFSFTFSIRQQPLSPQERDDPNLDHETPQPMSRKS